MALFTPLFLGFTTIIIKYSLFIRYSYDQISKKKIAKMYHTVIAESVKQVDFDGLFLTAILEQ